MSEHWWFLTRASGIVAWGLLTVTTLWGVALASRIPWIQGRAAAVTDLHRWLATLAVVATITHMAALVADSYVEFTLTDLFVPMASNWRRGAVAYGVVGWWLLVAIQVTSLLRQRINRKAWHLVHLTSYALCWTVTVHGARAGTDASRGFYRVALILIVATTVAAATYRVVTRRALRRATRPAH